MNYADIKKIDVANGEGVRVSLFVSGCNHHCKGCFNQCAWDFNYGNKFTEKEEQKIIEYMDHDYIEGLSLLGGEPLEPKNQEGLLPLVKEVKEKFPNKNIWCYTGFDFEKDVMGKMASKSETTRELLKYIDVIVDGKFEEDKKDLKLQFRGSSNQRIIDVKESLKENKNVIIMTENNLDSSVDKVLSNVNLAKEEKDRITKIDWKNDNLNKFKEVKKASKDGKDTLIFVKGKENYIENMNRNIENWIDINEVKVVDCYDINEIKDDVRNIAKKYNGILSTSGVEKLL